MGWGASLSKGLHMITKEVLTCEICQEPIHPHPISGWAQGHNAWPLHEGRCCDSCNNLVIAERVSRMAKGRDEWMTPAQAAEAAGISYGTVLRLLQRGEIPSTRVGPRLIRIRSTDVRKLILGDDNDAHDDTDTHD